MVKTRNPKPEIRNPERRNSRSRAAGARGGARAWAVAAALAAALAAGCYEVKDHLTINPDGSGTVRIQTVTHLPMDLLRAMPMGGPMQQEPYPPRSLEEARQLFPGDAFKVEAAPAASGEAKAGPVITVTFTDVNRLIESPYGRAHSLWLAREGDELVLKARTGMQAAARAETFLRAPPKEMPIPLNPEQLAAAADGLAVELKITMPAAARAEGKGAAADGSTVTWALARSKFQDAAAAADAFDSVLTVRCAAQGVAFTPKSPLRLDLWPFGEVKEGRVKEAPKVDVEKVRAAVRLVPVLLRVQRAFDLSGRGFHGESGAQVQAVILVPAEHAPQRWGEPVVTEARDDRGSDLLPARDEEARRYRRSGTGPYRGYDEDEEFEEDEEAEGPRPAETLCPVQFDLKVPPLDARKLVRLKGSIEMLYAGDQEVVRIAQAVPNEAIATTELGPRMMVPRDGERPIASPRLEALGVKLAVAEATRAGGLTMLRFAVESEKGSVDELQVFDGEGRPWPVLRMRDFFGRSEGQFQVLVAGTPAGPLSLALLVTGAGPAVTLPLELTDVPLTGTPPQKPEPEKQAPPAEEAAPGKQAPPAP